MAGNGWAFVSLQWKREAVVSQTSIFWSTSDFTCVPRVSEHVYVQKIVIKRWNGPFWKQEMTHFLNDLHFHELLLEYWPNPCELSESSDVETVSGSGVKGATFTKTQKMRITPVDIVRSPSNFTCLMARLLRTDWWKVIVHKWDDTPRLATPTQKFWLETTAPMLWRGKFSEKDILLRCALSESDITSEGTQLMPARTCPTLLALLIINWNQEDKDISDFNC